MEFPYNEFRYYDLNLKSVITNVKWEINAKLMFKSVQMF